MIGWVNTFPFAQLLLVTPKVRGFVVRYDRRTLRTFRTISACNSLVGHVIVVFRRSVTRFSTPLLTVGVAQHLITLSPSARAP
ncbi:hypothetical protein EDB85DRAFT_246931 [Lactarius pseudohatsudake]|nr:hypothetical protein EDB85DRAFT_246931 [Lactarius pseudohatsudake]